MNKRLLAFVFAILAPSFLMAAEAAPAEEAETKDTVLVASWIWKTTDDTAAFRFNVNNSDLDEWDHVVDGDVTSYSIRGVKPGEEYTLYLQQSYDRINWSDTAVSTIVVE